MARLKKRQKKRMEAARSKKMKRMVTKFALFIFSVGGLCVIAALLFR